MKKMQELSSLIREERLKEIERENKIKKAETFLQEDEPLSYFNQSLKIIKEEVLNLVYKGFNKELDEHLKTKNLNQIEQMLQTDSNGFIVKMDKTICIPKNKLSKNEAFEVVKDVVSEIIKQSKTGILPDTIYQIPSLSIKLEPFHTETKDFMDTTYKFNLNHFFKRGTHYIFNMKGEAWVPPKQLIEVFADAKKNVTAELESQKNSGFKFR